MLQQLVWEGYKTKKIGMRDKLRILNIPLKNDSHKQHDDQAEVLRGA